MNNIFKSSFSLAIFTMICITIIVFIVNNLIDKIDYNKKQVLIKQLHQLVKNYDNDIVSDSLEKILILHGKTQRVIIYLAKKNNKIIAKLIKHTYPSGYNGNIEILTAVNMKHKIIGVRVLNHQETPGLGDNIDIKKSNWILSFNGASLINSIFKLKKNGGNFDGFTGATITPQAIITANYDLLQAIQANKL